MLRTSPHFVSCLGELSNAAKGPLCGSSGDIPPTNRTEDAVPFRVLYGIPDDGARIIYSSGDVGTGRSERCLPNPVDPGSWWMRVYVHNRHLQLYMPPAGVDSCNSKGHRPPTVVVEGTYITRRSSHTYSRSTNAWQFILSVNRHDLQCFVLGNTCVSRSVSFV